jgi:Fur family ferric uptake transcriptional regulator
MKGRFRKQLEMLSDFCTARGLHRSGVREKILLRFLSSEHHITAAEFWEKLRREHRSLDLKTVQSALDLLVAAGLARELRLEDGSLIYEHAFAHRHHDHLICRKCGRLIEFAEPKIEMMQEDVAARHGFVVEDHTLSLYGVCSACAKRATKEPAPEGQADEKLVQLYELKPGQKCVVHHVEGGRTFDRRLASMNIRPGKAITKVSSMLMGGPVVVAVDGRQLAIGQGMARKIMVALLKP